MELNDLKDSKMQAMRIKKSIGDSREITIKIPVGFSDNVEIIVLPLETEELSEREFEFFTLNHAIEDDDSEDKVWQRYLTSGLLDRGLSGVDQGDAGLCGERYSRTSTAESSSILLETNLPFPIRKHG